MQMLKGKSRAVTLLVLIIYIFSLFGTVWSSADNSESHAVECGISCKSRIFELLFGKDGGEKKTDGEKEGPKYLYVGGEVFGAKVRQRFVSVTEGNSSTGLLSGDKIISVNGMNVNDVKSLKKRIELTDGEIFLTVKRGENEIKLSVTPKIKEGARYLGVELRDCAAGVGTVTFVDKNGVSFGGLGHGICDGETAELIDITDGDVTGVILGGVDKGEEGKPGELCGILTPAVKGSILANTECGVFGTLNDYSPKDGELVPIGSRNEIHRGEAQIVSTIKNGKKSSYKVEIFDVDKSSTGTKSFKIRVTDPALIAITGGIVRGMSGSPIIQDGKLVGAVTHVMVANPTEGYGIFIENMLNASNARNELPNAA